VNQPNEHHQTELEAITHTVQGLLHENITSNAIKTVFEMIIDVCNKMQEEPTIQDVIEGESLPHEGLVIIKTIANTVVERIEEETAHKIEIIQKTEEKIRDLFETLPDDIKLVVSFIMNVAAQLRDNELMRIIKGSLLDFKDVAAEEFVSYCTTYRENLKGIIVQISQNIKLAEGMEMPTLQENPGWGMCCKFVDDIIELLKEENKEESKEQIIEENTET